MSDNSDSDSDSDSNQIITETKKTTYFNGLKDNKTVIDKDHAKNYIIFQNDFLHLQVNTLESKINKMKSKIKGLESDNESMETSKNNLKFYIKNEHELSNYHKKINDIYDEEICKIKNELIISLKKINISIFLFIVLAFVGLYFNRFYMIFGFLIVSLDISFIEISYTFLIKLYKLINIKKDDRIIKYRIEINRANQGNKYLDDLIDNF